MKATRKSVLFLNLKSQKRYEIFSPTPILSLFPKAQITKDFISNKPNRLKNLKNKPFNLSPLKNKKIFSQTKFSLIIFYGTTSEIETNWRKREKYFPLIPRFK